MGHALSFEMEELTQFMPAQFGPMSHPTTAILTCQFCQNSDHEQTRPEDSAPHVDDDDRESFVSRHRARLNQKATLPWEEGGKPKLLYLSWRNLSLVCKDFVSTIYTCESFFFIPALLILFPTLQQPCSKW